MKPPMRRWTRPDAPLLSIISHRKGDFYRPNARHQEHEINLALSGEALYQLGGQDKPMHLSAGEILLMPAGTVHAIEVRHELRMAAIHIHPRAFDQLTAKRGPEAAMLRGLSTWKQPMPWRKVIAPDAYTMLERLAEEAVVEQNRQSTARLAMLDALATQAAVLFLRLMLMEQTAHQADQSVRRILTVQSWIDRHFSQECTLQQLAGMSHLAPTYFAAQFRKIVGLPPMTYLRDRRLEQARLLLQRTSHPIKVVVWSVGYSDVSHFTRVFKAAVGLTPADYRLQVQRPAQDD